MRALAFMALGLFVLTAAGVEPVGVGIDAVAVPASAVSIPIDKAVVPLSSVTRDSAAVKIPSLEELVATVRDTRLKECERLAALEKIADQDAIFYLFFKPGEDRNLTIRLAAVSRLTEVNLLKALGAKAPIPEVREAVDKRLETIYSDSRDRGYTDSSVVRAYVQRMRSRR